MCLRDETWQCCGEECLKPQKSISKEEEINKKLVEEAEERGKEAEKFLGKHPKIKPGSVFSAK